MSAARPTRIAERYPGRYLGRNTGRAASLSIRGPLAAGLVAALLALACWAALVAPAAAQAFGPSIVPDGSTATLVSQDAAGRSLVSLAPADNRGTSLNRFGQFDVTAAGADLDNQTSKALTIVNEVTSTRSTTLAGEVRVLGPSANVLIANPNGIILQSGSFVNVGNLGLITASVEPSTTGPWRLPLKRGEIRVLGAAVSLPANLTLAGKQLRLDAPLTSTGGSAGEDEIQLITGEQDLSLDGQQRDTSWLQAGAGSGASSQQAAMVLGAQAALQAGALTLIARDSADGKGGATLEFAGSLVAQRSIDVSAAAAVVAKGARWSAGQDLLLRATLLDLGNDSHFTAQAGAVLLSSSQGDISLVASKVSGQKRKDGAVLSRGGVSFDAAGKLSVSGSQLESLGDDLSLVSGSRTSVQDSSLAANRALLISSQGDADLRGLELQSGEDMRLLADGDLVIADVRADAASDLRLDGHSIRLAATLERQTYLKASQGGLTLLATGSGITNLGALLQGARKDGGDAVSQGAVTLIAGGDIVNQSLAADRLAAIFGQDGPVWLQAGGALRNINGRLLSNADMKLTAAGQVENRSLTNGHGLALGAEIAYVRAEKTLAITGDSLVNVAGEISAGTIHARLAKSIEQRALALGGLKLRKRRCFWFACSYSLKSLPAFSDASIRADQSADLEAGAWLSNLGGSFVAGEDLRLAAPSQHSSVLLLALAYQRPGGLNRLFLGPRVFLKRESQGGLILAGDTLSIEGSLERRGGGLMAGEALKLSRPERFSAVPGAVKPQAIGWFSPVLARLVRR